MSLPTVSELAAEGRLPGNGSMPSAVRRWAYFIIPAARANGIPADMVAAVMTQESEGDPTSWVPGTDARGLMQILHGPWDPAKNIDEGTSMLAGYKQQFKTWKLALAAYNAGPGNVISYGGVPPFPETENYVVVVQYLYEKYSNHPLTGSKRAKFRRAIKKLRRLAPKIKHLHAKKIRKFRHIPGLLAIPDGCDPSGGCRPRNLPHPLSDPFWPIGGSSDPLPVVSPSG